MVGQKTLHDSNFKRLYNAAEKKPTCEQIWEAVKGLVAAYEGKYDAKSFYKVLQRTLFLDDEHGKMKYADVDDAKQLAILLWSSVETGPAGRELCSLLNQCIREDKADAHDEPIKHAVVLTRAINRTCVTVRSDRQKAFADDPAHGLYNWPSGPDAEVGWSTEKNVTFRGGALPEEHVETFFTKDKKFRSNMFLATSFDKSVAYNFMKSQAPRSRVVWRFEFDPARDCGHVNFLGGDEVQSAVKSEREFLLTPYTILDVASVELSEDVETTPHQITLRVASDNKMLVDGVDSSESLDLAPWG